MRRKNRRSLSQEYVRGKCVRGDGDRRLARVCKRTSTGALKQYSSAGAGFLILLESRSRYVKLSCNFIINKLINKILSTLVFISVSYFRRPAGIRRLKNAASRNNLIAVASAVSSFYETAARYMYHLTSVRCHYRGDYIFNVRKAVNAGVIKAIIDRRRASGLGRTEISPRRETRGLVSQRRCYVVRNYAINFLPHELPALPAYKLR